MRKICFQNRLQAMVLTGVFAALLAALSQISLPMPSGVPVTLQTFAVALCGFVLGARCGAASLGVYLALGAVGIPVFAGFSGGFGVFLGMTGGFLWGFLPMVFLCGLGTQWKNKLLPILFGLLGMALCHAFGVLQYALVSGASLWVSFLTVSVPYLLKDAVSVAGAYGIAQVTLYSLKRSKLVTVE